MLYDEWDHFSEAVTKTSCHYKIPNNAFYTGNLYGSAMIDNLSCIRFYHSQIQWNVWISLERLLDILLDFYDKLVITIHLESCYRIILGGKIAGH